MSLAVDYRFLLLVKLGSILYPSYRFKWPQMDWVHDPDFNSYLKRFGELHSWNSERRWIVWQLTRLTMDVPGDTAECGSFEGADSFLICKANAGKRHHHIFDSFEGLSEPEAADETYWEKGALARTEDVVRKNLAEFTAYTLHKGWIPARFDEVTDRKFSYVHIDVDLYQPTLDSLKFFYPRMSPGGIIICDDYGFSVCPGATRGIDEFLSDQQEQMIPMPGGGGFLIKGIPTTKPIGVLGHAPPPPGSIGVTHPSWGKIIAQTIVLVFDSAFRLARMSLRRIIRR